ncbi:MAG: capsule assembly Wzi family protein, partial [Acidobacteria bacterium]|nr:capsule assembly Wzi family protein [Acidobacteriota bacterium]
LTDGLHFGQTIAYDFGRPNRRGANAIAGGSAYASTGPLAVYFQAEYQHAPSAPALSDAALDHIARIDGKPRAPAALQAAVNRARLMEAYAAINVANWQISVGRQSLDWGVGEGGSMLLSDNVEPLPMVRVSRVVPRKWPSLFRYLGPVRSEFFFSRLDGQTLVARPFFYGLKTSIRPHRRLEIGYARTTMVGGGNFPLNFSTFFRSLVGLRDPSIRTIPGDTRSAFDLLYRVPAFDDALVLYAELFAEDDEIYFSEPMRGAPRLGAFIRRLPWAANADLRVEYTSSESPGDNLPAGSGLLNYFNFQYRDGYAHRGFLLGNVVGRAGRAVQVWSSYWFAPTHRLQFGFKFTRVHENFVPGGGLWHDYALRYERELGRDWYVRSGVQIERIARFPLLFPRSKVNATALLELRFAPGG